MYTKILFTFLLLLLLLNTSFASEDIKIISRAEWGADETHRYLDSEAWQNIIAKRKQTASNSKKLTPEQKEKALKKANKLKTANNFLNKSYSGNFTISSIEKQENGHKLARAISKSKVKNSIIIHHTDGLYTDSYEAVRSIYKFHALNRQWGDIGYNYLIGLDGEIFEGRAGGDYTVGAHDKWNNNSSIGIAIIGNYNNEHISDKQYNSLEKLASFLRDKYQINFNKKQSFFKWCSFGKDCDTKPIIVSKNYPIIGHRDAGTTNCPGDELYKQVLKLRAKFLIEQKIKTNKLLRKIFEKLKKADETKMLNLLMKIEILLDKNVSSKKRGILELIKHVILEVEDLKKMISIFPDDKELSFDDENKIKVKLSYPNKQNITIKLKGKYKPKLKKKGREYILSFLENEEDKNYTPKEELLEYKINFKIKGDKLFFNSKEVVGFNSDNFFRIKAPSDNILTISSWNRKPSRDTTGTLNDNKFKGDLVLYMKNNELVVVNDIVLSEYLKGLGEVSNSENVEKIKTIITLARSYGRHYMTDARKFPGEWYDASDDPNVFQRYLGFGYQQRSGKVSKVVNDTKDIIVTYNKKLIKPWYFSQSDGKTLSYKQYCISAGGSDKNCSLKFPFLSSTIDPSGIGKTRAGHGVGVPGSGVKYLSDRGWNYEMMIKYFLKGVEIEKKY